jgi:hypothetical protein
MFNFDRWGGVPWEDLHQFLMSGDPPVLTKLLVINTLFLVLYIYRKARGKHRMRAWSAYGVQFLLIAANFMAMFEMEIFRFVWQAKGILV